MEIKIVEGNVKYIYDCTEALVNSELGRRYFSKEGSGRKALEEGFTKGEIFVALDNNGSCKGFMWIILNGIFHSFPYLHIIAVKEENRNEGIGKKLLKFFEDICFNDNKKAFLVVADFNPGAKTLYERMGYVEVGAIPNLYRAGITEYLMMRLNEMKANSGLG